MRDTLAERPDAAPRSMMAEPVRLGLLASFIGFHLRLAQDASFAAFARRTGDLDLTPGRFTVLLLVDENPGITQTALSQASGRDKSTLTATIRDLETRGYILRRQAVGDRRSYTLTLTASGKEVLAKLLVHAKAHDAELDRLVGVENKAELVQLLRKITMGLST